MARNSDYVMRSEKRESYEFAGGSGRSTRRRRRKAGAAYIAFALVLSVLFWPLGMLLFWRRKVRWNVGGKLLLSLVTLLMCIMLIGLALTVPTRYDSVTRAQDNINDFLDKAVTATVETSRTVGESCGRAFALMGDFNDAAQEYGRGVAAELLEKGAALAEPVRVKLSGEMLPEELIEDEDLPEPTVEPTATPEPTPAPTKTPSVMTVKSRAAADATVYYNEKGSSYHSVTECGKMKSAEAHTLLEAKEKGLERCTLCAAPELSILDEKYVLWLDEDECVHTTDDCIAFSGEYTLVPSDEANGYFACTVCGADIYETQAALGIDVNLYAEGEAFLDLSDSDEEYSFDELTAAAEPAEEAAEETEEEAAEEPEEEAEEEPAEESEAATETPEEEAAEEPTEEPTEEPSPTPTLKPTDTPEPTEEPTPTPEPMPTATPEPEAVTPSTALKPAGEATVYHSSNGSWYHLHNTCKGMSGSKAYKLEECEGYKHCNRCNPPELSMIGQMCLWQDEDGLCHTSDECASFKGDYALILRDDALAQECKACPDCGAEEYLLPNTVIVEAAEKEEAPAEAEASEEEPAEEEPAEEAAEAEPAEEEPETENE